MDVTKLEWINSQYIREKTHAQMVALCTPYWQQAGIVTEKYESVYLEAVIALEKDRLKKLADITEHLFYFKEPVYDPARLVWKKSTAEDAKTKLGLLADFFESLADENFALEALELNLKQFIADQGFDNGSVLWPLRVSLTGLQRSPGPFEVAATLYIGIGKAGIIERIRNAAALL